MNRVNVTKKLFQFPITKDPIELSEFRNEDGTFKNGKCTFLSLREFVDGLNACLLPLSHPNGESRYNLRLHDSKQLAIVEVPLLEKGRYDYLNEKVIHKLTVQEGVEVKNLVLRQARIFFEPFLKYYIAKSGSILTVSGSEDRDVSDDLSMLLRFSTGLKIEFLEDLCALYLGLGCQRYFDVVCHIVLCGAYTLSSLFSTTGLYYTQKGSLTGWEFALQATISPNQLDSNGRKFELRTIGGLVLHVSRQVRLKFRSVTSDVGELTSRFVPFTLSNDEDDGPSGESLDGARNRRRTVPSPKSKLEAKKFTPEEIFLMSEQRSHVLNFGGLAQRNELRKTFVKIIDDMHPKVSGQSLGLDIIKMCDFLHDEVFDDFIRMLDQVRCIDSDGPIYEKIRRVDEYSDREKESLESRLIYIVALCDNPRDKGHPTVLESLLDDDVDFLNTIQKIAQDFSYLFP